ncbi:MAG: MerR family transcriptional regulator, partial [Phycicoccus sp.]
MELTIDELAARSGVSVRTIRFYAGRDLIPPPRLRGRTGLYDDDHLARLELIRELSALGFTLSATERYLARLPARLGVAELALHRALLTPWVHERAEEVDRAELDRRAGRPLVDADVDALARLGVLEPVGDGRVRLLGALGAGVAMLDSGVPVEVWHRSGAVTDRHATALAEELMQV